MNNTFDMSKNNFLIPYYKQFQKLLKNNKILLLENIISNASEYFIEQGITVTTDISDSGYGGIILNNYLASNAETELPNLINTLANNILDQGIILLINNTNSIDKDTINYLFKNKFEEVEELIGDNKWNFILYQKKTTK